LFVPVLLVNFTGLPGAVIGYLIVMCILLVLLVSEYASIRMDLHRKLTGKAAPDAEMPRAARTAAMAPVQVAGAQAVGVQAGAPAEANAAVRGAHAPKESMANAPISWTAGGTVGIAQPEPEAPESGGENESDNA
ncbi:MAG: hypothetical protein U0N69_04420, partial [Senegalimassilia anaerobia]